MHQALYRKYRSATFDEVVGQDHITTTLKNEIKFGKIAHSYLFTGSRGTGKTSCAKILAKAVNCRATDNGNPCGVCNICVGIDEGKILDVTEMDAASNSSVEDVRSLREEAHFTPTVAKYRVFIIDEVHMLSVNAFNALLKIMEEPPEHVLFILATTEIHKVLPTIISRCQRFDFKRISNEVLCRHLKYVCLNEGFEIDNDAVSAIATLSEGGMRDALSLLDVCSSYSSSITLDTVISATGIMSSNDVFDFVDLMIKGDTKQLLIRLDNILSSSVEPGRLCDQLISHYRNLMIAKTVNQPDEIVSCLPAMISRLKQQVNSIVLSDILHTINVLQDTMSNLSRTTVKKIELEVALIRLSQKQTQFNADDIISRIETIEYAIKNGNIKVAVPETSLEIKKHSKKNSSERKQQSQKEENICYSDVSDFEEWNKVMVRLAKLNPSVAGMMANSKAFFDGRRVLIDIQNSVLLEMLKQNDYTKNNIKQAILDVTGKAYSIGPYISAAKSEFKNDNFESFLTTLPKSDVINIIQ